MEHIHLALVIFIGTFEAPLIFGANIDTAHNNAVRRYLNADISNMKIKLKYTYEELQQLSSNLPTPVHSTYLFDGWYTAASGGTKITASNPITPSSNITLYVRWAISTTVTFEPNGGTGTMNTQAFGNSAQPISTNAFYRSGYGFTGWNTEPDGSGTSYSDRQMAIFTSNTTLYAQWKQFHSDANYFYSNGSVCFNGTSGRVINTGIELFSTTNYNKNFEIYYDYVELGPTNVNQAVLMNTKDESGTPYPGGVNRMSSATSLQIKFDCSPSSYQIAKGLSTIHNIRTIRIGGEIYYSINGGAFVDTGVNYTDHESTASFSAPVAFGGAIKPNGDILRPFNGVLSNMYVGFIDNSITLSDYENGYTAPRTATSQNSASSPNNISGLSNPKTLSNKK